MNHTIRRARHGKENPYFLFLRQTAQDKRLSYEARGMLAYLLSKPDDWEVRVDDLILGAEADLPVRAGKTKVYSILNELAQFRYIKKPERYKDAQGQWVWTAYEVYEEPYPDLPEMDLPELGRPELGRPYPGKPEILQSSESLIPDSQSTEEQSSEVVTTTALAEIFRFWLVVKGADASATERETIPDDVAEYGANLVKQAMKIAQERARDGKKRIYSWKYVQPILEELRIESQQHQADEQQSVKERYTGGKYGAFIRNNWDE